MPTTRLRAVSINPALARGHQRLPAYSIQRNLSKTADEQDKGNIRQPDKEEVVKHGPPPLFALPGPNSAAAPAHLKGGGRGCSLCAAEADYRRGDFVTFERIRDVEGLRLAHTANPYVENLVRTMLPNAELVEVSSVEELVLELLDREAVPPHPGKRESSSAHGAESRIDAVVTAAEKAAALSLLYPHFSSVIPTPVIHLPAAFPIPHGEEELADYMKIWLTIRKKDGTIRNLYDYWVLGKQQHEAGQRWSIIRDVLHWEAMMQSLIAQTEDAAEGITAFFQKRKPQFKGR